MKWWVEALRRSAVTYLDKQSNIWSKAGMFLPAEQTYPILILTGSGAHGQRGQVSALAGVFAGKHALAQCVPGRTCDEGRNC